MTKDMTTINKLVVKKGLRRRIKVHLNWNWGIIHSRNKRSFLNIKEKNFDYGEARGLTKMQTKVIVVDPPKKEKNDYWISALETQNKDLNDKITQLLATVSAQGQTEQEPQNTTVSNRTNLNLVSIHRPPTQKQSWLPEPSESLAGRKMISDTLRNRIVAEI